MIIDGHCDSLEVAYDNNWNLNNKELMFNIEDVKKYLPYIQFLATFINTKYIEKNLENGYIRGNLILDKFDEQYLKYKKQYNLLKISNYQELLQVESESKLGILLTTENGAIIGDKIENIAKLYNRGIIVMGITWNDDNLLGSGALTKNDLGLTNFGVACIKEMNRLNMIVDVSHLSYKSFWDTCNYANNIIATHSNVYSICNHPRNLKDDQIKEIASRDGVIGICLYKRFVSDKKEVKTEDIVEHIEYIANMAGINYIALGTDFDGIEKDGLPDDIKGVKDINAIAEKLYKRGFKKEDINKIMRTKLYESIKKNNE